MHEKDEKNERKKRNMNSYDQEKKMSPPLSVSSKLPVNAHSATHHQHSLPAHRSPRLTRQNQKECFLAPKWLSTVVASQNDEFSSVYLSLARVTLVGMAERDECVGVWRLKHAAQRRADAAALQRISTALLRRHPLVSCGCGWQRGKEMGGERQREAIFLHVLLLGPF